MTTKLEDLATFLSGLSGSPVVSFNEKPAGVSECLVYKQIISNPIHSSNAKLLEKTRIQIDCYGSTPALSRSLADLVKTGLDMNQTNFKLGFLLNDFIVKDLETGLQRSILEFQVW